MAKITTAPNILPRIEGIAVASIKTTENKEAQIGLRSLDTVLE
jgi:hypothetical protein